MPGTTASKLLWRLSVFASTLVIASAKDENEPGADDVCRDSCLVNHVDWTCFPAGQMDHGHGSGPSKFPCHVCQPFQWYNKKDLECRVDNCHLACNVKDGRCYHDIRTRCNTEACQCPGGCCHHSHMPKKDGYFVGQSKKMREWRNSHKTGEADPWRDPNIGGDGLLGLLMFRPTSNFSKHLFSLPSNPRLSSDMEELANDVDTVVEELELAISKPAPDVDV